MTIKTAVVQTYLKEWKLPYVPLNNGQQLQVLPNISLLSKSKKHHYAVFIKDIGMLVVWDDEPSSIIHRAEQIEAHLVKSLWADAKEPIDDKSKSPSVNIEATEFSDASSAEEGRTDTPRPTVLYQAFLTAITACLIIFTLSIGWRKIAIEISIDHNYTRLAILAATPLQLWIGWFFFASLVSGVAQCIGPVKPVKANTKNFSGLPSPRIKGGRLPHVTVQCPVYKEGLEAVIHPTIVSLNAAISTYELQGGTANIFVNDDGMQLLPEHEAQERRDFYEDHNIGWVARPKHSPKGDENGQNVFVRAGKFKKASNMNYALNVSARIEDKMAEVQRQDGWTQDDEDQLYQAALAQVIEEDQGRTWADGDLRIGDYILIIDSDTRVPEDCFLDAVSEMELSPQVAIIQFSSGVMNVTTSFFEKGITFFTNLVYAAIRYAVAMGDVAPFVGHNAILRWSAVQDVAYMTEDGVEKYWAENTVSEDFDMALRVQSLGYIIRFNTIFNGGFEEGVSLTVYDELSRWEKYAYGCSELLFHPFKYWIVRGPFTPLFRKFVTSSMPLMAKITIMSYIGTYFAISAAWILTVMNYFLIGWYNGFLDHYYVDSFKVYFGIVVVFQALGTVALALMRYRIDNRSLISALLENCRWLMLLTIFLGGISLHVSQAICCHLTGIDMSWGATAKEATNTSFFKEIPTILKKFKFTFAFCIIATAGMIILAGVGPVGQLVPYDWQITGFTAIFPMAVLVAFHFIMPLALNPGLMQFTF